MDERDRLIAILVDRLGGDVTISESDLFIAGELELLMAQSESSFAYILRTRRTITGEVATEPHPTQAQLDDIVRNHRQALESGYANVMKAVQRPLELGD